VHPVSSVVGRWQLRSANSGTLVVPRTRSTIGRRDFAVSGPATWNSLPVELRTSSLSSQTFAEKNSGQMTTLLYLVSPISILVDLPAMLIFLATKRTRNFSPHLSCVPTLLENTKTAKSYLCEKNQNQFRWLCKERQNQLREKI